MKIIAASDTHNERFTQVIKESCDIFIHPGDLCVYGNEKEFLKGVKEISKVDAKLRIYVPGNHDKFVEKNPYIAQDICKQNTIVLLNHDYYEWEGVKFFGSPYVTDFSNGYWSFERKRFERVRHWEPITEKIDILITHTPPFGVLDASCYAGSEDHMGCDIVTEKIKELKPDLHFFGHNHSTGQMSAEVFGTKFYNCAFLNNEYKWRPKGSQRFWVVDYNK